MARQQSGRYVLENGNECFFSKEKFRATFARYQKSMNGEKSQMDLFEDIAEEIGKSTSTLKHWLHGHNAPTDIETVADLAECLHVEMEELLNFESEEKKGMEQNVSAMLDKKFVDAKDAIGDIYSHMVAFVEMYRADADENQMWVFFKMMHMHLMAARWNIPMEIHNRLRLFVENYLQQMLVYNAFRECVSEDDKMNEQLISESEMDKDAVVECYSFAINEWWENIITDIAQEGDDTQAFYSAIRKQIDRENEMSMFSEMFCWNGGYVEIINGAYARLEELLKEYLPQ